MASSVFFVPGGSTGTGNEVKPNARIPELPSSKIATTPIRLADLLVVYGITDDDTYKMTIEDFLDMISKENGSSGLLVFSDTLLTIAQGTNVLHDIGGQGRRFEALITLENTNFPPSNKIPAPTGTSLDAGIWEEKPLGGQSYNPRVAVGQRAYRQQKQSNTLIPDKVYQIFRQRILPPEPGGEFEGPVPIEILPDVLLVSLSGNEVHPLAVLMDPAGAKLGSYNEVTDEFSEGGTGGGKFAADFLVVNGPFGKYQNGTMCPAGGKSYEAVILDAYSGVINPTYSPATLVVTSNVPQVGEVGESLQVTVTATFNRNDAGAFIRGTIIQDEDALLDGQGNIWSTSSPVTRTTTVTRTIDGVIFSARADYAAGAPKNVQPANTPDTRPAQVRSVNAPQAAEQGMPSNELALFGLRRIFYGPAPQPSTTSVQARSLPGFRFTNAGNVFELNTGTTATVFEVIAPANLTVSVKDLDALNAPMPYAATALNVNDAGGAVQSYKVWRLTIADPYSSNHRHEVTLS